MAVSGGIVEYFPEGARLTYTCSAAVTAGQLVEATGDRRIGPAGANSLKCQGVALRTGSAAEDQITVANDGVWPLTASGAIAEGDYVKAGAAGTVVAIAIDGDPRLIIGRAIQDIANAVAGPIKMML
ncbi:MAG: DUF2190 family protein [Actinomycetota bacterium]|nr:DUF2190 family protein [Actinomycetota bacterium]